MSRGDLYRWDDRLERIAFKNVQSVIRNERMIVDALDV